ncbi:unnamed protein product [Caenorhabditis auriculariae]|uniref:SXP/RAL-2 family protein Ani s 5-like cation-binding domain-containing protein n=1 Tax=Caenorhabditis auriculariae TaxID=2777116 RepID=A0A8S1HX67_9PELO|nr:unnamed protein product [Caenorhabditis auriculariae]
MTSTSIFVISTLLAVLVAAFPIEGGFQERIHREMQAAGISQATIDGIQKIADNYKEDFAEVKSNPEVAKAAFEKMRLDVDTYIKTAPAADQAAWKTFAQNLKAELEAHRPTVPS